MRSCAALPPSSPSGYYWVRASNGSAVRVYCDMTRSCGGVTGGWTRVAELDMTNSSHQCPSGLRQRTDSNIRTCVRNTDSPGCSAVQYSTANIHYSRVCGKVIAYQYGTTNAFLERTGSLYPLLMWMVLVSLMEIPGNIYGHLLQLLDETALNTVILVPA